MEKKISRFMFRMWHNGLKKMTYWSDPDLTFEMPENREKRPSTPLLGFRLAKGSELYFGTYGELMQCTGKMADNDMPIYEGDVVFANMGARDFIGEIIYEDANYKIKVAGKSMKIDIGCSFIFIKVIGTVCENPELLEGY